MNNLQKRLAKQLKRSGLSSTGLPEDLAKWQDFLHLVDRSYTDTSNAQYLLERSLEVSSQEMRKLYEDVKTETEQRIDALHKSEQKTRFMANMSHELRTPIHGILGSLEIVKGTSLDEKQQLFIDTAYASCEIMLDIINNILDFSKLKAGGIELEIVEFSPRELVEGISDIMSTMAQEKNLLVRCEIADTLPERVKGDPARLRQMLMNLIGNAIKFTEHGEVYTGLSWRESKNGHITLRFEVRDTGIGIPLAMHKSVFESFIQVDASINRRYGGTGLGLTIVREFAEMMGGTIGLESIPDQGSHFWFEIPAQVVDASTMHKTGHLTGRKVLVVDDTETNRLILENYLQAWQAETVLVSSGEEALITLEAPEHQQHPFDLLLLDWFMPRMDGIALARAIRANPLHNHTPIVMLTSYGLAQEKQQQIGIQTALTKPIRSITLRDALNDTLQRYGNPAPITPPNSPPNDTGQNNTASESTTPASHSPVTHFADEQQRPRNILLAEDNPVNALIAITMLEQADVHVDHVVTGKLALKAIRTRAYDLVLMDINMPEMDGYTATRYIRKWEREGILKKRTPVIAMTANALKGDREKSLSVGMDDYLAKPVKQEELLKLVSKWLNPQTTACAA
ncbi:response regulator [Candidatus Thiothrix anitrata]|jgi:signal transduction histidine kinase/DNA-binding response OmpR family regulator|uniref:histidine kinase n=1 Tax=Candidatus Thiothrix anitrata TaxID=2823902 RepID=A0ABX7X0Q7_9GAMM|nr:response regulator [Candidatus Thiothrix anitrata]QTR49445.1 response regulator [Candidatus Thiothrix anitrata]